MSDRFTVTYRIFAATPDEARARAEGIALEQTVEIPRDVVPAGYVEDEILGRVKTLERESNETFNARLSYSPDSAGPDLPQLLNVIFGNSSIQKGIEVTGLDLGPTLSARFPGARCGIAGVRAATGRAHGGLVAPVIKPMGLSVAEFALTARRVAEAGADVVKEDHGLANQPTAPFRERVPRLAEAVAAGNAARRAAGDTTQALYFPNLGGASTDLVGDAFFAKEAGAQGVLIIPGLQGFDAIHALARDQSFALPIMAHPAFLGPHVLSDDTGFSHGMMFGTLMRLAGADISIFPNFGGRFGFSPEECAQIVAACRTTEGPGDPILPSPGGGMSLERMPEMMRLYGENTMYLLGGGLLRYGDRIGDAIREMRNTLG